MQKLKNAVTVLAEFRGGLSVLPKYFGGFTVFGTPTTTTINKVLLESLAKEVHEYECHT